MKYRWWALGMIAVAAGSVFMMKHLADGKKTVHPFVDKNNENSEGRFPHEILEPEFDEADYFA